MDNLLQIGIVLTAIDKMSGVLGGATQQAAHGFARLQQRIKACSATMTEMGTKATLMGRGILTALETPVKAFADLNEASTDLRVAMMDNLGRIPPQFGEINKQAVALGNVLPGTTADFVHSAKALIENGTALDTIVGGGLKAASYLGVILKLPQAGAAEMVAKFREAFGLTSNELVKMADLTQRAKFAFGLDPEEIKYAAQYAGSTLNNLKLTGIANTKMFLAMQGMARQKGMEGSVFGTNFSSMLNNIGQMEQKLHKNSKVMRGINSILRRAGIHMKFFDKAGNFVGLEKMVSELQKLNVLSSKEKILVMNKLFGEQGGRVTSILAQSGVAGLHEYMGRMARQADIMQRIKEITKSAKNTWEALTGTIENFWAAVGEPMVTALYPLIQKANEFVGGPLMDWVAKHKELVKWLGLGTAALGVLLVALGGLGIVAGAVGSGLAAVVGVLGALISPVRLLVSGIGLLGRAATWIIPILGRGMLSALRLLVSGIGLLGRAVAWIIPIVGRGLLTAFLVAAKGAWALTVALAANPITWIIAAVIALGVAIYMLVKHWDAVKAATQRFWTWFTALAGRIGHAVGQAISGGLTATLQAVSRAATAISRIGSKILAVFMVLPAKLFHAGVGMITQLWAGIKSAAGKLYSGVADVAAKVRSYWPFSPAKAGPLRDLHRVRIIETIASAVHPEPLVKAMGAAAAAGMLALAPLTQPVAAMASAAPPAMAGALSGRGLPPAPRLAQPLPLVVPAVAKLSTAPAMPAPTAIRVPSLQQPAQLVPPALAKLSAAPAVPAPAAMPKLPPLSLPLPPAPKPAPRLAQPAAAQSGAAAPVTVHFAPQITVQGSGTTKDGIMAALKAHEHELVQLIEQAMARNARRQY